MSVVRSFLGGLPIDLQNLQEISLSKLGLPLAYLITFDGMLAILLANVCDVLDTY